MARSTEMQEQARQLLWQSESGHAELVHAEAVCRRAMALRPNRGRKPMSDEPLSLLGEILLAQGRDQEALECLLEGNHDGMTPKSRNLILALAYCRVGNFEMAKKHYSGHDTTEWHAAWPGGIQAFEASLLYTRAGEESSTANYRGTSFYLKQAEKLAPTQWFIADKIGDALYDLEHPDEAVAYYRRAMELGGDKVSYEHRMRVEVFDLQNKQKPPR